MAKFAFLVNNDGYKKYTYEAAKSAGASVPRLGRLKRIFEIHNAEPLNRYFELPFKNFWYKRVVDESKFNNDDVVFFVLYESFHMSYSRRLICHYKKKYKNAKFIFLYTNPVNEYNFMRVNKICDLLDGIFTFNIEDSKNYSYFFLEEDLFILPRIQNDHISSDVFFVGADKGRLPILLDLFDLLSKKGLICDFWITGVPEEKQKYSDKIHYNQRITYEEVLRHNANTRCIIEVLQDGKSYTSLRTYEAIQYRKKLLTMNDTVKAQWFFNPKIIQVFHSVEDISVDFIRSNVEESVYDDCDLGSFNRFEKYIAKVLSKERVV